MQLGRFEVREYVGHGGFGVVYRAFDSVLAREVALKFPRPEELRASEIGEWYLREARIAANLDHPGIVPVYDAGEIPPLTYIASGFVAGPTLRQFLAQHAQPLNALVTAHVIAELATALQHAHDRGVLHRDLKPSNVLLDPLPNSGAPFPYVTRLTDFGLASRSSMNATHEPNGAVVGTPRYMSPEQARGDGSAIGVASDIYSLGVILYEMLTGRLPAGLQSSIRDAEPQESKVRSAGRPADVPPDLEAICRKCLEQSPSDRYASASALETDLRRFLGGSPVAARPVGRFTHAAKWCRRRPAIAGLLLLAACLAMGGLGGIVHQWRQTQLHAREAELQATNALAEKQRAERHLAEAQQSLLDMTWMFQEASPFLVGEPHVLHDLQARLGVYYSQLLRGNASDELRLPILAANRSFATLSYVQVGVPPDQRYEVGFREAADLWWEVVRKWPERTTYRRALVLQLLATAEYFRRAEKDEDAARYRKVVEKAVSPPWTGSDADAPAIVGMAKRLEDLAEIMRRMHRNDDAMCLKESVVLLWAHLRELLPRDEEVLMQWAAAQCRVAAEHEQNRNGVKADEILAAVEQEMLRVRDWSVVHADVRIAMADVLRRRATLARDRKDLAVSVDLLKRAAGYLEEAEAIQIRTPTLRRTEIPVFRGLGKAQLALGEKDQAFRSLNRCRVSSREALELGELSAEGKVHFGRVCADAGTLALDFGKNDEAEKCFAEAVETFASVPGTTRWVISDLRANAESATMLARIREAANRPDEAHALYERALGLWQQLKRREPRSPGVKQRLALVEEKLGLDSAASQTREEAQIAAPDLPTEEADESP